jgi:hypothetical protein
VRGRYENRSNADPLRHFRHCPGEHTAEPRSGRPPAPRTRFDVQKSSSQSDQIEPGKALVCAAEVFKKAAGELGNPTIRIGLDGTWMGATRSKPFFFFLSNPASIIWARAGHPAWSTFPRSGLRRQLHR